jgi:hypothetical protein
MGEQIRKKEIMTSNSFFLAVQYIVLFSIIFDILTDILTS